MEHRLDDNSLEQALNAQIAENARLRAEASRAIEERMQFVSLMVHELKIPMTSIKGYAKLLDLSTSSSLSEAQKEQFLKVIVRNVDRLDRLVSILLDLARCDGGRMQLALQGVELGGVLQRVLLGVDPLVRARRLVVRVEALADASLVHADPERLLQIVASLVGNACQYTPEGGIITVRVRLLLLEDDLRRWVELRVCDTGIGIADSDKPRVFYEFFKGDHPLVREAAGSGFSLMLTRRLVERHGGRIGFTSELGRGSEFFVVLPAADVVCA